MLFFILFRFFPVSLEMRFDNFIHRRNNSLFKYFNRCYSIWRFIWRYITWIVIVIAILRGVIPIFFRRFYRRRFRGCRRYTIIVLWQRRTFSIFGVVSFCLCVWNWEWFAQWCCHSIVYGRRRPNFKQKKWYQKYKQKFHFQHHDEVWKRMKLKSCCR